MSELAGNRTGSIWSRNPLVHILSGLLIVVFATEVDKLVFRAGWVSAPGGAIVAYIVIFGIIVATALAAAGSGRTHLRDEAIAKVRDNQLFLLLFLGLILISLIYWLVDTSADSLDMIDMLKAFIVCSTAILLPILSSHVRRFWRVYLGTAFGVYCLSIWIDALWPGTFTELVGMGSLVVEGRISGLNLDSNSGAFIVALLVVPLLSYRKFKLVDLALLSITSLTILLTLSKSGMIILLLLVISYFVLMLVKSPGQRQFVAGAFAISAILTVFLGWVAIRSIGHYETPRARIAVDQLLVQNKWFRTRLLSTNEDQITAHLEELEPFGQVSAPATTEPPVSIAPATEPEPTAPATTEPERSYITYVDDGEYVHIESRRVARLRNALDTVADSPILGHGIGFNRNAGISAHNMFLAVWIDFGLLGLILYIVLLAIAFWKFYRARHWPGMFFGAVVGLVSMTIQHIFTLYTVFIVIGLMLSLRRDDLANADEPSKQLSSGSA